MRYVTLRKLLTISLLHFTDITGGHIGDAACRHEGTGNRRARGRPLPGASRSALSVAAEPPFCEAAVPRVSLPCQF